MSKDDQILAKLASIETDVAVIKDRLNGEYGMSKRLKAVEDDVKTLHGYKWWLAGIASVVGVGWNFIVDIFKHKP